jgi:outer membrane murein-binding lipoprotein Lpp
MKIIKQTNGIIFLIAVITTVTALVTLTYGKATTPTLEELAARVEILRTQQQVLTADVNDFKVDVVAATGTLREDVDTISALLVPVGSVVAWWGNLASIPVNFELCDGNAPTTPGAILSENKPNLLSRFIRGASSIVGVTGGQDLISDTTTLPHTLTVAEMPSHNHNWNYGLQGDDSGSGGSYSEFTTVAGPSGKTPISHTGGSQAHSHGMTGHDNRPAFCELFYIIRVK